jgi:DUF4097 and DUF4098 domain-containing protein YvlB
MTELRAAQIRIMVIGSHAGRCAGCFHMNMKEHTKRAGLATVALAAAGLAIPLAGCIAQRGEPGTVDRTFTVNGPVRLELTNGASNSKVTVGSAGEVRIHADFRVKSWSEHSAQQRADEMKTNPPFSQEGNLIRVGGAGPHTSAVVFNYAISVPPETEVHAASGSGNIEVAGVRGPVAVTSGSGNISASDLAGDVQAHSGSGTIQLATIQGQVQATAGSGGINLATVHGDVRVQTGSGVIRITYPAGAVVASAGSGSVSVAGAMEDLRLRTSSGNIAVAGDPQGGTYWDFRTSSGNVALQVSPKASFRFYAKTNSGDIDAAIPVVMEGTAGKHALRARIGDGKGRVEVETSSGNVALH